MRIQCIFQQGINLGSSDEELVVAFHLKFVVVAKFQLCYKLISHVFESSVSNILMFAACNVLVPER